MIHGCRGNGHGLWPTCSRILASKPTGTFRSLDQSSSSAGRRAEIAVTKSSRRDRREPGTQGVLAELGEHDLTEAEPAAWRSQAGRGANDRRSERLAIKWRSDLGSFATLPAPAARPVPPCLCVLCSLRSLRELFRDKQPRINRMQHPKLGESVSRRSA